MASAGMVTVTNSYANKTPEALAQISPNLMVGEPTREGLREAMRAAFARAGDFEGRVAGAALDWPSDWGDSLDESVLERLQNFIDAC
jgi:hypothetical protein